LSGGSICVASFFKNNLEETKLKAKILKERRSSELFEFLLENIALEKK